MKFGGAQARGPERDLSHDRRTHARQLEFGSAAGRKRSLIQFTGAAELISLRQRRVAAKRKREQGRDSNVVRRQQLVAAWVGETCVNKIEN